MTETAVTGESRSIVVGVDGSEASIDALRWAVGQARLSRVPLRVVAVWHLPLGLYGAGMPTPISQDIDHDTADALRKTVGEVVGDHPDVDISTAVLRGHPAPALVDAASGADLLVVGSRGHGAFAGMLLGSVSAYCASHANCPVVIVRTENSR